MGNETKTMLKKWYEHLPRHNQDLIRITAMKDANWSQATFYKKLLDEQSLTPIERTYFLDLIKKNLHDAITTLELNFAELEKEVKKHFKLIKTYHG